MLPPPSRDASPELTAANDASTPDVPTSTVGPASPTSAGPTNAGGLLPDAALRLVRRTAGLALVAGAALPFALGALAWRVTSAGRVRGPSLSNHLVLNALGIPDPVCGATRAFILFAHGDERFLDYNPVWVFFALAVAALGLFMAGRRALGLALLGRLSSRILTWLDSDVSHAVGVLMALLALGWLMAFVHLPAIRQI